MSIGIFHRKPGAKKDCMRAESVYDVVISFNEKEKERLFEMLKKPLITKTESPFIYSWQGLSSFLDNTRVAVLKEWEDAGLINKYEMEQAVYFKKEEVIRVLCT